jgi:hypothetical protein
MLGALRSGRASGVGQVRKAMKHKRLPPYAEALRYAGVMVITCVSKTLSFRALVYAWQAGYRYGRAARRRAMQHPTSTPEHGK